MHRHIIAAGTILFLGSGAVALGTDAAPTIDGSLDDPFWAHQARVWEVADSRLPENHARFYLGYDDAHLYFAADVTDRNVSGTHTGRKDEVRLDDAVVLMIDVGDGSAAERTPDTYEYGFSAAGAVNWTRGTGDGSGDRYPARGWPAIWDSGVHYVVQLKPGTTLNRMGDRDPGYVVEARIPWAELGVAPPVRPDRTIGVLLLNYCRPEQDAAETGPLASMPGVDETNAHDPSRWQRIRLDWEGPLAIRGLVRDLPLGPGAGTDAEARRPRFPTDGSHRDDPPWNPDHWDGLFTRMQEQQLNALLLMHPRPFRTLLERGIAPDTPHFDEEVRAEHRDRFRWLLDRAGERDIAIYLSVPAAGPEPAERAASVRIGPATREQTASAVTELFAAYPSLSGLVVSPPDRHAGVPGDGAAGIAAGLNEVARERERDGADPPRLIYWTRLRRPEDAAALMEAYPHTRLLHSAQEDQWFSRRLDPRIPSWDRRVAALRGTNQPMDSLVVGGPGADLNYLFWADPAWMRDIALDVRRHGLAGMFLDDRSADPAIVEEAFGLYAVHPGQAFNARRWEQRFVEVYGAGEYAGQLLELMKHASAIPPMLQRLVHDPSGRFMPQFGLLLVHYLDMPTISSYRPPSPHLMWDPAEGSLPPESGRPPLAPADWGEQVAGVRAVVQRRAPRGATPPNRVADDMRRHADAGRSLLLNLRHQQPEDEDQAARLTTLLDRLQLNLALGEHMHQKIRAAVGWEGFHARHESNRNCLRSLRASVDAWREVVEVADRLYPDPVPYRQSQIVSVPPWAPQIIANSYRPVVGHWRDQLARFEWEFHLVQLGTNRRSSWPVAPLWDQVDMEPPGNLETIHRLGFEVSDDLRFTLLEGASLTRDADHVLHDRTSVLADTRLLENDDWQTVMVTDPGHCPLRAGRPHQIAIRYRVLHRGDPTVPAFAVGVMPAGGGPALGTYRAWTAPEKYVGDRFIKTPPLPHDHYVVFVAVRGRVALVFDQISISGYLDY